MMYKLSLILPLLLCAAVVPVQAQERTFGLGAIIGEPTGLSAKYWTSPRTAMDFELGWSFAGNDDERPNNGESMVSFHMDYLWHSFDALNTDERLPIYYGIGGRINTGFGNENSLAVRGVVGIAWMPRTSPIDIFFEVAPTLQLVSTTNFGFEAGFGARYYF